MSKLKRITAMILVLSTLVSFFPASPMEVQAAELEADTAVPTEVSVEAVDAEEIPEEIDGELVWDDSELMLPGGDIASPDSELLLPGGDLEEEGAVVSGITTAGSEPDPENLTLPAPDTSPDDVLDDTSSVVHSDVLLTDGDETTETGLTWAVDESLTVLTISGDGAMDDYAIEGAPWYEYRESITQVVFAGSVTNIGNYAFYNCSALTQITLPDTVTVLGRCAFASCTALEQIELPDTITSIGYECFVSCTKLSSVNIPLGWTDCPSYSTSESTASTRGAIFRSCESLTSIEVPEGIAVLPAYAFNGCEFLEEVTLPDTLTEIANHAFYNCTRLKRIEIFEGVTSLGKSAFCYCSALTEVKLPESLTTLGLYAFNECTSLAEVKLPDAITSIGYRCFYGCTALNSINIPLSWTECTTSADDSTTENCGQIFGSCSALTYIEVPEGMTALPSFAFNGSDYLEEVKLPETLTEIKNHAFYGCSSLKSVEIPKNVTAIGKSAFCNCTDLAEVTMYEGVTTLSSFVFYNCDALVSLKLPDSITAMGWSCFAECALLSEINVPMNWTECTSSSSSGTQSTDYCGKLFYNSPSLKSITVPEGMTALPGFAFNGCNYLEEVKLPETLTEIKNHSFCGCSSLKRVEIPKNVTAIGKSAFCDCTALEEVTMYDGITQLGSFVFYNCDALTGLTLPDSITAIGWSCFAECALLSQVDLPLNWTECLSSSSSGTENTSYCGNLFNNSPNMKSITIPDGMTTLPTFAFNGCNYLEEVIFPDSLTDLGSLTFYNCDALESITIPDQITTIPKSAFYSCDSLAEVNLPDTMTSLGHFAFASCTGLESIDLPDSITTIGYKCFSDCTVLAEVGLPLGWTTCSSNSSSGTISASYCGYIFYNCENLTTITVPEGMTTLPNYAFNGCNLLQAVYFPDSLTAIPNFACYNCINLLVVQIPLNATSIGTYAFAGCTALMVVNIPSSVTSIGRYAFYDCSAVQNFNYQGTADEWSNVTVTTMGNTTIKEAEITTEVTMTGQYGVIRPNSLGQCFYSSPDEVSFTNFYGANINGGNLGLIDVNYAFFGKNAQNLCVTIPIDSFVTLRFEHVVYCNTNAYMVLRTTGVVYERADLYFLLEDGTTAYYGELEETEEYQKIPLDPMSKGIIGLKFVGKDLDGAFPGFDLVDVFLIADETNIDAKFSTKTTAVMQRDGSTYNLLRETQDFKQNSVEKVTVIVTPDWGTAEPGHVELRHKGRVVLENGGGTFVDIQPGMIFDPLDTVYAVLLDASGTILESVKLQINVLQPEVSRDGKNTVTKSVTVYLNQYDNDSTKTKYEAAGKDVASALHQDILYTSSSKGVVKITEEISETVTFSAEGYVSRTLTAERMAAVKKIYLEKQTEGKPVISAVWVDNKDILRNQITISLDSEEDFTFEVEVDWNTCTPSTIQLWQEGIAVDFESNNALTVALASNFDLSSPLYIQATAEDGTYCRKQLKIETSQLPQSLTWLEGTKLELGDGFTFALPKSFPVIGGQDLDVDVNTLIPFTFTVEDGKIYVAIGIEVGKVELEEGKWSAKSFATQFKETGILDDKDAKESIKKLKNLKKTYKDVIKKPKGSFGVEADFDILGFMEGTFDAEGNITWLDSGMILSPSVEVGWSMPFTVWGVPFYVEVKFKAAVTAQLNLFMTQESRDVKPDGVLSSSISLRVGLNVGLKKVASAGVGGRGHIDPYWLFRWSEEDYFKVTAGANFYLTATIACFSKTHDFGDFASGTIYETTGTSTVSAATLNQGSGSSSGLYDASQYRQTDLSYLNTVVPYTLNAGAKSVNLDMESVTETVVNTNIYQQSATQYLNFADGTALAAWLHSADTDNNNISVYYSYYNGQSWSTPAQVQSDGTMDSAPVLKLVGADAYLVWQNATQAFESTATAEDAAPSFDISVAKFTAGSGFEISTIANDNLDMMPTVCGDESNVYVVWLNNSENDWFGDNQSNHIYCSTLTDSGWSEPTAVYSNLSSIDSFAADYAGVLNVAYSMDTDGDINTIDDLRLYVNGVRHTQYSEIETSPAYLDHQLYWHSGAAILAENLMAHEVFTTDRYQLLENDGTRMVLYTETNDVGNVLMASYYDEVAGLWCDPVALTAENDYVLSFHGSCREDGALHILLTRQTGTVSADDEITYGLAQLVRLEVGNTCDLAISDITYDAVSFTAGEAINYTVELTNTGSSVITSYTISAEDENGNELASFLREDMIMPGETLEDYIGYAIPEDAVGQTVTFRVIPTDVTDSNSEDNSQTLEISYENLRLEDLSWGMTDEENICIYATVVNRGYHTQSDLTVSLYRDSLETTPVAEVTVDALDPLDMQIVTFDVAYAENDVFFVAVSQADGEYSYVDNSDFLNILPEEDAEVPETAADVTYVSASLSLEGDIGLNYYVQLSDTITADEGAYMEFTYGGTTVQIPLSQAVQSSDGSYRFACPLSAKQMTEAVVAQMYTSDGTAVGEAKQYSIKTYCDAVIAAYGDSTTYAKLVDLVKAMLNYGAYSQLSFGYNTDVLANADLDASETVLPDTIDVSAYQHVISGSEDGISVYAASLLLESTTTIRFFFQLTGDKTIDAYEFLVGDTVLTPTHYSGSYYYVDVVDVAAKNLDEMYTVNVGGLSISYGGLSYVNQVLNSDTAAETTVNVAKALYLYNQAANTYFGE